MAIETEINDSQPTRSKPIVTVGKLILGGVLGAVVNTLGGIVAGVVFAAVFLGISSLFAPPQASDPAQMVPDSNLLLLFLPAVYICWTGPIFGVVSGILAQSLSTKPYLLWVGVGITAILELLLINVFHGGVAYMDTWQFVSFFGLIHLPAILGTAMTALIIPKWIPLVR